MFETIDRIGCIGITMMMFVIALLSQAPAPSVEKPAAVLTESTRLKLENAALRETNLRMQITQLMESLQKAQVERMRLEQLAVKELGGKEGDTINYENFTLVPAEKKSEVK